MAEGIDLSFSDEECDEEVAYLVQLVAEDHPFEHNSWSGGKDAAEVHEQSSDPQMEDEDADNEETDDEDHHPQGKTSRGHPEVTTSKEDSGRYAFVSSLIKEAANSIEERLIQTHEANVLQLKAHFDTGIDTLKSEIAIMLANSSKGGDKAFPSDSNKTHYENSCFNVPLWQHQPLNVVLTLLIGFVLFIHVA